MGTVPLCERCHGLVHERGGMVGHRALCRLGLERAKAAGVKLGRPSKDSRLDDQMDKIQELLAAKTPIRTIAAQVGVGASTLHRFIHMKKLVAPSDSPIPTAEEGLVGIDA